MSASGTSSPGCRAMWEESVPSRLYTASSLTVTVVFQSPPAFCAARPRVISLVIEAGYSVSSAFFSMSTCPVSASATM